ncbi:(2Fe-2S) ferredoxin domain-containing protein [Algoriphagus aestuarii]|nr:(2Fe-2S) ferredoxin domain-containing protein [Algoriphagus aestuarii]
MESRRKLILVCEGSDCKKAESKALRKSIEKELNSGEFKGQCKLIRTKCMDFCKSAPVVIVGEHVNKKATLKKVIDQLKKS